MFTVGGLFSGIGGIETGFEKAGFKISWSNENDPYSVRSFKHNYKHELYSEDIRKLNFKKIKSVDVLVGGFPCQAFSVAGYQKGFKDPRGNLFFEICRAITELPKMPKVLMLENVKNIRGHDGGKTAKVITKSLRELGYSVFWNLFNTSIHTDIPQNRERELLLFVLKMKQIGNLILARNPLVQFLIVIYLYLKVKVKKNLERCSKAMM